MLDYDAFSAKQVRAGLALLQASGLTVWDLENRILVAQDEVAFETVASVGYERLKSWILFSVGAEYLVKGLCAYHGVPDARDKAEDDYLTGKSDTLGSYFSGSSPRLAEVAGRVGLNSSELIAFCRRLADIRNRDVHLFVLGARKSSFPDLDKAILPMLNRLFQTISESSDTGREIARGSH